MLDLKLLENGQYAQEYRQCLSARNMDPTEVDRLVSLNARRKKLTTDYEMQKAEQNRVSEEIAKLKRNKQDATQQLEAMKKMGSMTKLLGMIPGANSGAMKKQLEQFDEGELVKTQSIVQSMTPLERNDPKVLNGSRRLRIANGSGRQVSDVNSLVERFSQAQKVMKQMRTGNGGMQLPPGMQMPPGMPKPQPAKVVNKKKSRSGNPAKRALEG
jgi:signal recognition particle GTPase